MNSKEIRKANTKRWLLLEDLKRKGVTTTEEEQKKLVCSRFWDPVDPSTWVDYRDDPFLYVLYPYCRPLKTGRELYLYPVFELYRVEITRLHPPRSQDFNMILLASNVTRYVPFVIYNNKRDRPLPLPLPHEKEEEIKDDITGRPLPLRLPERLPCGEMFSAIFINNPIQRSDGRIRSEWMFCFDPVGHELRHDLKCDEPLSKVCTDEESGSQAVVSYEIIREAVKAVLVFRFISAPPEEEEEEEEEGEAGEEEEEEEGEAGEEEGGQRIQILSGTISAAHFGGDHPGGDTKRIVKYFPSHKRPEVVYTNKMLPVDRHVFGVPYRSKFRVTAEDLICATTTTTLAAGGGEQEVSRFGIRGTLDFDVPTATGSEHKFFATTDSTILLRLTVSWVDACL